MSSSASAQIEIDYLRDEIAKLKEQLTDVKVARQLLKSKGYYVDNLWTTDDVMDGFDCGKDMAYKILDIALTNVATIEQIQYAIGDAADYLDIKEIKN